jgi:multidrug efflux pump subunit AcrA (membrane-fusion protein)
VAEFRMPSLGADMEAGTLVEWLVQPGDHVKHGDIVAVVETQSRSPRQPRPRLQLGRHLPRRWKPLLRRRRRRAHRHLLRGAHAPRLPRGGWPSNAA